jgi:predicted DCC family thiol-disulfide oxidoreductase YuxK
MERHYLVHYDGHCKLCSRSVRWIIRNDVQKKFSFMEQAIPSDTLQLIMNGKQYERSSAVLRIAMHLRFPWPFLGIFYLVPRFIRDAIYAFIARKRKRWFGEETRCVI